MSLDSDPAARALIVRPSDRRLLRNDVFELLLERIMDGTLEPGSRLKDSELTTWLGVSRTPVREAVGRMAGVGLIETAPNRFTIVARLSAQEALDAIAVLERLYPDVVRQAMPRLGADAELEIGLLAGRLERDPEQNPVGVFLRVMQVALGAVRNMVLAETVDAVHLRVLRHLRLAPGATGVMTRERVLAFAAAVRAGEDLAVTLVEKLLGDAAHAITAR